MNIYVSNIPYKASAEQLKQLFTEYGEVSFAEIVVDKVTQRSRGFGFIEMVDDIAGRNAINKLNMSFFMGKDLVVNEARPREKGGSGFRKGDLQKRIKIVVLK